jgi:hypothetical protein
MGGGVCVGGRCYVLSMWVVLCNGRDGWFVTEAMGTFSSMETCWHGAGSRHRNTACHNSAATGEVCGGIVVAML